MINQHIDQHDRGILHVVYNTVDLGDDIVVKDLKDDRGNQTEYRC
jgi:hypothetical protein